MSLSYYTYAGLQVASELVLPEWERFATPPQSPDVWIRLLPAAGPETQFVQAAAGEYALLAPHVAHYRVSAGSKIEVMPLAGAGQREIRLFLLGSAWAALCYQRGLLALHASVVQIDGQTLAFSGASGAGKSTLAASLVRQGGRLVSDDLCCIELASNHAGVYPAAPRLKLWRSALDFLGLTDTSLERDLFRMDKFHLPWRDPAPVSQPVRLDGIYLLAWGEPALNRLRGMQAVNHLAQTATYHPEIVTALNCSAEHWQRCLQLAKRVPVWLYSRPQDWSTLTWPLPVAKKN